MRVTERERRILHKLGFTYREIDFHLTADQVYGIKRSLAYQAADLQIAGEDFVHTVLKAFGRGR